jgi:phosphoribosylamine---glycine ligase
VKVLVVGAGGREHAIVRALRRSPQAPEVLCAPGNPGIAGDARCCAVAATDVDGIVALAEREDVGLTVVGPEAPLVAGVVDALRQRGRAAFGPTGAAARLEGSKAFAKEVMAAAGVPTARWTTVDDVAAGMAAIERYPVVLKFDGLAAGKGVVIAPDEGAAREALGAFLVRRRFGAGRVVVEEYLAGEELSLLALCDGETAVPMAPAQDYKRIFDGDAGPNTGGMGSYSPVPGVDEAEAQRIARAVHQPVVDELRRRGTPFHGTLYAGVMLTAEGPRVLEFNARFGDPETQAVLPRLRSDLLDLLTRATAPGGLAGARLEWDPRWAVTVVLASAGYPESASTGDPIAGLDGGPAEGAVEVTHAGTALGPGGELVTGGGRVLNVTGLGDSPAAARDAAYAAADRITFEGRQLRRDIALRAVERTG